MGCCSYFLIIVLFTLVNGVPTPPMYDTIVVGLGASGTTAAATLAAAGKKVLGLEAQNRIGGRVYTVPFGDSTVEVGAEWIHGTIGSVTYELAVKNNVSILEQQGTPKAYRSDGSSNETELFIDLLDVGMTAYTEPDKASASIGQYVTDKIHDHIKEKYPQLVNNTDLINNFLKYMEIMVDTYESSGSWNDLTTRSTSVLLGGSQDMSWHRYGYKTLFEILLNKYNNGPGYPNLDIKLNTEVTKIEWPQDPNENVVVTVKNGTSYTAKNVIVTVSVGVLQERYEYLFSPPLPEAKVSAIKAISMGVCVKTIMRFPYAWWDPTVYYMFIWKDADKANVAEEDAWTLGIDGVSSPMSMNTTLTSWTCGDAAKKVESLPAEVVKEKTMGIIRRFLGHDYDITEPVEILKSSWYTNPYTRGVYTYDNLDIPKHPTARADLGQPLVDSTDVPRVLFAGEATAVQHFSTVHGAIETGRREANRLLALGSK